MHVMAAAHAPPNKMARFEKYAIKVLPVTVPFVRHACSDYVLTALFFLALTSQPAGS
ncbi:hypothetical protein GCM10008941_27530 [Rhizomicrobium palustre]